MDPPISAAEALDGNTDLTDEDQDCLAIQVNFEDATTITSGFADVDCQSRDDLRTICTSEYAKLYLKYFLIHSADPKSRPVVIFVFAHVVHPSFKI